MTTKLYVTLPLNPNNGWQPCRRITGHWAQFHVTGPHVWAVRTVFHDGEVLVSHGSWDATDARCFARSMADGERSQAVEVAPYWYCRAWGVVPAEAVHELDEENTKDWSHRPRAAVVLGTGER